MKATNKQKALIHKLVARLNWSSEGYKAWLYCNFHTYSSSRLDVADAAKAIEILKNLAESQESEYKITAKQISYIRFLWLGVDYALCCEGDTLLNNFLSRRYGVGSVEELSRRQAYGAIAAIKKMQVNIDRKKGEISVSRAYTGTDGKNRAWITLPDGSKTLIELNNEKIE